MIQRGSARERGMTLIELGMVLAITVIVLGAIAPRLSSLVDTSKQDATARELVQLHAMAAPIVEKLAFPTPPTGVVLPRTPLTPAARAGMPAAIQEVFPTYFDGLNPFQAGNPYFLTIQKQFLGGAGAYSHDMYVATLDTCIPEEMRGIDQRHSGFRVQPPGAPCAADEVQVVYQAMVSFSQQTRELRAMRRYFCCGDRSTSNPTLDDEVFCMQWGRDLNPQDFGFNAAEARNAYFSSDSTALFCR